MKRVVRVRVMNCIVGMKCYGWFNARSLDFASRESGPGKKLRSDLALEYS